MRRASTNTVVKLELSQTAYDEIERKLFEGGYAHLFERGPGSAIDMSEIVAVREEQNADRRLAVACKCGWRGSQASLTVDVGQNIRRCPNCLAPFAQFPARASRMLRDNDDDWMSR